MRNCDLVAVEQNCICLTPTDLAKMPNSYISICLSVDRISIIVDLDGSR